MTVVEISPLRNICGKLLAPHCTGKREPDHVTGPDPPRGIENARAGKPEMGEEDITGMVSDFLSLPPDREPHPLEGKSHESGERERADKQWGSGQSLTMNWQRYEGMSVPK